MNYFLIFRFNGPANRLDISEFERSRFPESNGSVSKMEEILGKSLVMMKNVKLSIRRKRKLVFPTDR